MRRTEPTLTTSAPDTHSQLRELEQMGCQLAQGFLLAHPNSVHDIEELAGRRTLQGSAG
jgi:EAL domain-containing protein (putative c-di-GMP-specific phosphodiesterase class I)